MAGETNENVWKPALVENEDALVPAFIIEEHARPVTLGANASEDRPAFAG